MMLLKLHKYLNWADKKLHSHFFLENKDQINEDLLADFKTDGGKITVFKEEKNQKPKGIVKEEKGLISHHEFMFGKHPSDRNAGVVDVTSQRDFPSLSAAIPKEV